MVFMGDPREGMVEGGPAAQNRYYRRIPTQYGQQRNRGYYNVLTGDTLTEHQYLRRFRRGQSYTVTTPQGQRVTLPAATEPQLQQQTTFSRDQVRRLRERRQMNAEVYIQQQTDQTLTQRQAMTDPEFQRLNQDRAYYEYQKRQLSIAGDRTALEQLNAPGGPFATTLEQMGLRPPGAWWMVGDSDSRSTFDAGGFSAASYMDIWRFNTGQGAM